MQKQQREAERQKWRTKMKQREAKRLKQATRSRDTDVLETQRRKEGKWRSK